MKKITVKHIIHDERRRLSLEFVYDRELISITKQLNGVNYSGSLKCWHIEDNKENLRKVLMAFREVADIDLSNTAYYGGLKIPDHVPDHHEEEPLIPRTEIKIVKEKIRDDDLVEGKKDFHERSFTSGYSPVEFRIEDERLSVRFTGYYDKKWIDEIRSYGKYYYDKVHREFLLKWSKITVDSLSDYFSGQGVKVIVLKQAPKADVAEARKTSGEEVRSRELKTAAREGVELLRRHLEEYRYSNRTVESYISQLELFFKYYHTKDPHEISHNEVSDFINDFVLKHGFSASFQNQMVSAIKLYYELSGKGRIIPGILERPRRSRALPKVFSKDEIARILNSARNSKHKLLLWIIYSCGLRRSEVTNIRLTDFDRERNILHIREGKGGVDRIVPVPGKLWPKVDEYLESHRPGKYLFEGQSGQRYSVESVYHVFKKALRDAGIQKEVGVHSLRHSYATHLHENGLDIRYIQELLGHKSTRTTEIYTHVSRRNLVAIRSPIEDLDVKEQVVDYLHLEKTGVNE